MKKLFSLFFILLLGALAACSQESGKESESGVAAVVNGVEITNRQVEYLYQRSAVPDMSAEQSADMKRRILSDLVRIELLAGKAKEMSLDKSPDYSMELYATQKNVLAGLAEHKLANTQTPPSLANAESVVLNTPQLFSGRKLFVYDEVLFPAVDMSLLVSLDAMAMKGEPLSRLIDELKTKKIPFNKTLKALTSERIPSPVLSILSTLKPGVPQVVRNANKISIILELHDAIPAPLEGIAAKKAALAMIEASRNNVTLSKAMEELLDNAKITYYGEYSKTAKDNKKLSALPSPDKAKINNKLYHTIYLGVMISTSIVLGIVMFTAVMRSFYNILWLPRLWPSQASANSQTSFYEIRYATPIPHIIYLLALVLLTAAAVGYEIMFLRYQLSILVLIACVVFGIIAGIFASRLLNVGVSLRWSKTTYIIVASVLVVTTLASVLGALRLSAF
jgi:EpsD family peptidyl-prolyl cis-trans isomerase